MELGKAIQSRKSVKKFSSKKPDWRDIIECIDYMRYAPMAGNNFSLKFILVDDKEKIQKISEASQQPFICQAKYIVVVCSDPSMTVKSFGERGKVYCRQQAGAAIEIFLLKIQEKGLSTCWIGHCAEEQIKRELKIPEKVNVEAVFPIGYEFGKQRPSRKLELDRVLYFARYGNKKMKIPKKLDV